MISLEFFESLEIEYSFWHYQKNKYLKQEIDRFIRTLKKPISFNDHDILYSSVYGYSIDIFFLT